MITTLTIGGLPLDPCHILSTVTVIHGRRSFGEAGQPSSATVTVEYGEGAMPTWQTGDTLELVGDTGPMFSGRIVERALGHTTEPDGTRWGQFTVTAAGAVAALGVRKVGDVPWPQETGTARATRILTTAAVPHRTEGTTDLQVLARDVDAQPALGLLDELTAATGAAVFDTPAGEVVYQTLQSRSRIKPYMWRDFDTALTWAGSDPTLTWDGPSPAVADWISPSSTLPVVLPCTTVVWEPEWSSQEAAVINHVRIGYGIADPVDAVEIEDAGSVAQHGRRYLSEDTDLATGADAVARATRILTTQAAERWEIGDVVVGLPDLDPALYTAVMGLTCGDQVVLQGLPQPAPAIDWSGILEGWAYTQTGTVEQMTLALSDPLLSLMVMVWNDYPALYTWPDHGTLFWSDLDDVDILEAA